MVAVPWCQAVYSEMPWPVLSAQAPGPTHLYQRAAVTARPVEGKADTSCDSVRGADDSTGTSQELRQTTLGLPQES